MISDSRKYGNNSQNKDNELLTYEMAETYMNKQMETKAVFKVAVSLGIQKGRKQMTGTLATIIALAQDAEFSMEEWLRQQQALEKTYQP